MAHGDDNGLVLPPFVAPIQVIIIPIQQKNEAVYQKVLELETLIKTSGLRVKVDLSDQTPGWKYSEYEMKGVPLRLEVGPRDLEKNQVVIVRRLDRKKEFIKEENLLTHLHEMLKEVHNEMYKCAQVF